MSAFSIAVFATETDGDDNADSGSGETEDAWDGYAWYNPYQYLWKFTVFVGKSDDAENLGFNNAERWRDLVRSKISIIAQEHGIPLESLKWFSAFHCALW